KQGGDLARQYAPVAVRERYPGISNLALAGLLPQLSHCFDEQEDSVHPGVHARQAAAVRIHGERASRSDASARDERSAFAFCAEAKVLEKQDRVDRER